MYKKSKLQRFNSCKGCANYTCVSNQPVATSSAVDKYSEMSCNTIWRGILNFITGDRNEPKFYIGYKMLPYELER